MGQKFTLSPEQQDTLDIASRGGLDTASIATLLSIKKHRVAQFRSERGGLNGLRRTALQRGISPYELERRIASEYNHNENMAYLAGKYHTTHGAIHTVLLKQGVEIRPARRPTGVETFNRLRREGVAFATTKQMQSIWRKVR